MRKFISPDIVYAGKPGAGYVQSLHVVPHDLGVVPSIVRVEFICRIADNGYAPGDRVQLNAHSADEVKVFVPYVGVLTYQTGHVIKKDATNLIISIDTNTGMSFRRWNSPKNGRPSNGAWHFKLKAYAP